MRIQHFEWDNDNYWHIGRHNVSTEEVEEVCFLNPFIYRTRGRNRYIILGQSQSGRYLTIIIENKGQGHIRTVTARDMTVSERKNYKRR